MRFIDKIQQQILRTRFRYKILKSNMYKFSSMGIEAETIEELNEEIESKYGIKIKMEAVTFQVYKLDEKEKMQDEIFLKRN